MRKLILVTLVITIFVVGCSMPSVRTEGFNGLKDTSLYIARPSDLTHGGASVKESGTEFLNYLKNRLAEVSGGNLRIIADDNAISSTDNVISEGFEKAKEFKADYVLIITLGEMRDAAPMTFRSDYVSIKDGVLYRLIDKKEVWRALPYKIEGGNITTYNSLLDDLAKKVSLSILNK